MSSFTIAPANTRPFLIIVVAVGVILVAAMWLLATSLRGATHSSFTVGEGALRIRGDLYGRTIPLPKLRLAEARRVDFAADSALRPKRRTVGTAVPGYQSGWFRLRSGEKALLYLTDRSRAVYIPTSEGYSLLLSPADPDGLLAALRGGR